MLTIPFEYELRLAKIENNSLISLLTLFFNINLPIIDLVGRHSLSHQQKLEQIHGDNPENRVRIRSIRKKTNQLIGELLSGVSKKLQEIIGDTLNTNSKCLSDIDNLTDEEYRQLDSDLVDEIEAQDDFLETSQLHWHQLLAKITVDSYKNKQEVERSLSATAVQRNQATFSLIHYAEALNRANLPLINVLLQLKLIAQAPSVEQEFIWLDKDAYFQLAKIEQGHLSELLDFFRLLAGSNDDYWELYEDFDTLSDHVDFHNEEAEDLVSMQEIEELRAEMLNLHHNISSKIITSFMPLVTEQKKKIHIALSHLVEAKDNFRASDSIAGLQCPRRNYLLTPFTAIKSLQFSLNELLVSLQSPLQIEVTFKKSRAVIEDSIELNLTDGLDIGDLLRTYQQQLATAVGTLNTLWLQFPFTHFSSLEIKCAKALSLYELSHPLQKRDRPSVDLDDILEPPPPSSKKRRRTAEEREDASTLLPKAKAKFTLFNQKESETMEFHDLPEVGTKPGA